jgi:hypothetical protein
MRTVLCCFLIASLCPSTNAHARKWSDATGKYSVEGELVEVKGKDVVLKKTDGKTITLPISKLSKEDQDFLADDGIKKKPSSEEGASGGDNDAPRERKWQVKGAPLHAAYNSANDTGGVVLMNNDGENGRLMTIPLEDLSDDDRKYVQEQVTSKEAALDRWKKTGLPLCKAVIILDPMLQDRTAFEYHDGKVLIGLAREFNCVSSFLVTEESPNFRTVDGNVEKVEGASIMINVKLLVDDKFAPQSDTPYKNLEKRLQAADVLLTDANDRRYTSAKPTYISNPFSGYGCYLQFHIDEPFTRPLVLKLTWGDVTLSEKPSKL